MRGAGAILVGALAWGCGAASHEADPPDPGPCPGDPHHCCEPDDCECECIGFWHCREMEGAELCVQENPELPSADPYLWECAYAPDFIVCAAPSNALEGEVDERWNCITTGELIECSRPLEESDYPEGDGSWECAYERGGAPSRSCAEVVAQDGWRCELDERGLTTCRNDQPEQPDDGRWDCYRVDGGDYCVSDHFPDGDDADWNCVGNGEMVECERSEGQVPPGGGAWECAWGQETLECEEVDPDPPDPDPDPEACRCVLAGLRFCDEPTFGNWGEQECESRAGATRWSACNEIAIPSGCEPGGAEARDFEWHYRGGFWDGQVFDTDDDGVLIMPADNWFNPAAQDCAMRLGFCVQDMWDLDIDGDNQESVGSCEGIVVCI